MYIELIHLNYKEGKVVKMLCLRLVHYKDVRGRTYRFIINDWKITVEVAALIYKYCWTIELTFKKLKQNFQLRFFHLGTGNGIKAQMISHLDLNWVVTEGKLAHAK